MHTFTENPRRQLNRFPIAFPLVFKFYPLLFWKTHIFFFFFPCLSVLTKTAERLCGLITNRMEVEQLRKTFDLLYFVLLLNNSKTRNFGCQK